MAQPSRRLQPARVATVLFVAATVGCGIAITVWQTSSSTPAVAPQSRRRSKAQPSPTPTPDPVPGAPPIDPEASKSWGSGSLGFLSSYFGGGGASGLPTGQQLGVAVGDWQPGDPWPGGNECASGKLTDAFHMKPDKGCEPNCDQCQMVCLPGAFVGPFKNNNGELGGNCFERGCSTPIGTGSRSGVTFYMYQCSPALQAQWFEANKDMTVEEVGMKLEECVADCSRKDKACKLKCETTHQQEVAEIAIRQHAASGFAGEHSDAYQTATVMGFVLMCVVLVGIAGCFAIHAHHTVKPAGKPSKSAVAPISGVKNAMTVQIEGKVIQIATATDGQLCALTEDGRVYSWTADDAAKARGALEAELVENGGGREVAAEAGPLALPVAREPAQSVATIPTRAKTPPAAYPAAESPRSPVLASARPGARSGKQSISELKKSVNTIRAIS